MDLILRSNNSTKYFYLVSWKYICLLEIWSTWFQKELAIPRFKIPHITFKTEILVPFRKILIPFRTSILAGHFYWFGRFVPLTRILTWTTLWGHYVTIFDGPVTKYLFVLQWAWARMWYLIFFHDDILGSLGSNLVFIIPFGITLFLTEYHEWLWRYINEIWERVLAHSISGIHKSKIICSARFIKIIPGFWALYPRDFFRGYNKFIKLRINPLQDVEISDTSDWHKCYCGCHVNRTTIFKYICTILYNIPDLSDTS